MTQNEEKIELYISELSKWNGKMALVSKQTDINVLIKDVIASRKMLTKYINKGESIADIGSGNGVVAILFAILQSENEVFAIETKDKKCSFLYNCKVILDLKNLSIIQSDYNDVKDKFDIVLSKAFLNIADIDRYDFLSKKLSGIYTNKRQRIKGITYLEYQKPTGIMGIKFKKEGV